MYAIYQQQFASLVPAIAIGAACERGRILPIIPFTFAWGTIVYNVIAYDVVSCDSCNRRRSKLCFADPGLLFSVEPERLGLQA